MRRWYQFRLRTLLLVFVAVALVLGPGRWALWRYRVYRALSSALSQPADFKWWINPLVFDKLPQDDANLLLDNLHWATEKLLQTAETGSSWERRVNAVAVLTELHCRSPSLLMREHSLPRLIRLGTSGEISRKFEDALAETAAQWIPVTGVDAKARSAILGRVRAAPESAMAWAETLAAIGGRRETVTLLRLGGKHDPELLYAIHGEGRVGGCELFRSYWPGVFPYLEDWLADPVVAPHVLAGEYLALSYTDRGRRLLLAYATNTSHPAGQRRQAMEQLQKTV